MKNNLFMALSLFLFITSATAATVTCTNKNIALSFTIPPQMTNEVVLTQVDYKENSSGLKISDTEIDADQTDREAAYMDVWSFYVGSDSSRLNFTIPREYLDANESKPFEIHVGSNPNNDSTTLSCTSQ